MAEKQKNVRLRRELAAALVLKGILLGVIWLLWFSSPEEHSLDASKVNARFFPQHTR